MSEIKNLREHGIEIPKPVMKSDLSQTQDQMDPYESNKALTMGESSTKAGTNSNSNLGTITKNDIQIKDKGKKSKNGLD